MPDVLAAKSRQARLGESGAYPIMLGVERAAALEADDRPGTPRRRLRLAATLLEAGRTREAIAQIKAEPPGPLDARWTALLAQASLRLGEEANCLANDHAAEACILPFRGDAVHADPAPARRAAALFGRLAREDPGDLESRWLANVAHLAAGDAADAVPEAVRIPSLFATSAGAVPRLDNVAPERGAAAMGLSGGVSLDDFDGDGDLDLLATSWGLDDAVRYFVNDGRGRFAERTHQAGLDGITGGLNVVHGDVDNDGDTDVLILRGAWVGAAGTWPNSLLRNDGGRFTDVTFAAGLGAEHPTQTAAFADVDGDGWLDLFVGNESRPAAEHASELYLNNADGTFREAAAASGIRLSAFVKGVAWLDANGDGRPDLYASVMGGPNRLFLNRSTPGAVRFQEAPDAAGAAAPDDSFPVAVTDWDHDGDDDLLVFSYPRGGFSGSSSVAAHAAAEALGRPLRQQPTHLFLNAGGAFRDATDAAGLGGVAAAVMGVGVQDFDGDGAPDLYLGTGAPSFSALVPNRLLMSAGGGRVADRTMASGTGHLQKGHGVAFGDLDGDLAPDLYVVAGGALHADTAPNLLFLNPWPDAGWAVLRLEGRRANRSAIGARVAVHLRAPDGTARTLRHTVGEGGSFGAGSLQVEVSTGGADVERVDVVWPGSGTRDAFGGVAAGGRYRLVEGEATARAFTLRHTPDTAPDAVRGEPHGH